MEDRKRMKVLCPIVNEKTQKTYWMRIGNAFENRDGSTNIYLDALPTNRKLQIRAFDEKDFAPKRDAPATEAVPF